MFKDMITQKKNMLLSKLTSFDSDVSNKGLFFLCTINGCFFLSYPKYICCVLWQAEGGTMHGSGGTISPGGSITTGPACGLNRGGAQASFRSTVSDTEVENLQASSASLL